MFVVIPVMVAEVAEDRYMCSLQFNSMKFLKKNLLVSKVSWWLRCAVGTPRQCWFIAWFSCCTFPQL